MSNTLGNRIKVTVFGQSHSEAIGAVIEGLPAGFEPDMEQVQHFMSRRAPGHNALSTARKEADIPNIVSGLADGKTCGAPLCAVIYNKDQRSKDYSNLKAVPRPAHADLTAYIKYGGYNDIRGGGQFSGRLTAPLCFAGALCMQLLERLGVSVGAHILETAGIGDTSPDMAEISKADLEGLKKKTFPVFSDAAGEQMQNAILDAKKDLDSVGGIIRCYALGVPAGYGEPMFDGIENRLAAAIFGIPAVRGVSFGSGFDAAKMRGSQHNDAFYTDGTAVKSKTNNHGGILGGITSGMPIVMDTAIKPTPSIGISQKSVNLNTLENEDLVISGRHDPCIVPRAVPCIEAVTAITLLDILL